MKQRIVIEWEPYEHSDQRTVDAAQRQLRDRVVKMVGNGMRTVVRKVRVEDNGIDVFDWEWGLWFEA